MHSVPLALVPAQHRAPAESVTVEAKNLQKVALAQVPKGKTKPVGVWRTVSTG